MAFALILEIADSGLGSGQSMVLFLFCFAVVWGKRNKRTVDPDSESAFFWHGYPVINAANLHLFPFYVFLKTLLCLSRNTEINCKDQVQKISYIY